VRPATAPTANLIAARTCNGSGIGGAPGACQRQGAPGAPAERTLPPVRRTHRALARATIMLWLYSLEPSLCVGATTKGGCNRSSGGFVELETMQDFLLEK